MLPEQVGESKSLRILWWYQNKTVPLQSKPKVKLRSMQILFDFQNDFLKMIKLVASSPRKALEQINDLALKLEALIKGTDIDNPDLAEFRTIRELR